MDEAFSICELLLGMFWKLRRHLHATFSPNQFQHHDQRYQLSRMSVANWLVGIGTHRHNWVPWVQK